MEAPGPRERHLQRKFNNPLFAGAEAITQRDVEQARLLDSDALQQFMNEFHEVVQRAVKLDQSVESDVILMLKAQLEQLYAMCSGLQGRPAQIPDAIRKLVAAINATMLTASANDPHAMEKLSHDEEHTSLHFYLCDFPIVSDMLNPDAIISDDEQIPSLLNEQEESLHAALALFPPERIAAMVDEGKALLQKIDAEGHSLPDAWQRLAQMESWLLEA
jgi:hypothetical protein